MKMEDLNKQQIVLLTLFVSFITSIATGIVTVTLMQQAPAGVLQTINHVVEKTVQTVVPGPTQKTTVVNQQVVVKEDDLVVEAIDKTKKSLVDLNSVSSDGTKSHLGIGIVLTHSGVLATDVMRISSTGDEAVKAMYNGKEFTLIPLTATTSASSTIPLPKKIAFYQMSQQSPVGGVSSTTATSTEVTPEEVLFTPVSLADSATLKLRQTAIVLGGKGGSDALVGIISHISIPDALTGTSTGAISGPMQFNTNTVPSADNSGGAVLTLQGTLAGFNLVSSDGVQFVVPSNILASALQTLGVVPEAKTASSDDQSAMGTIGSFFSSLGSDSGKSDTQDTKDIKGSKN